MSTANAAVAFGLLARGISLSLATLDLDAEDAIGAALGGLACVSCRIASLWPPRGVLAPPGDDDRINAPAKLLGRL